MPKYRKKPVVIDAIQWDGSLSQMKEIKASEPFAGIQTLYSSTREDNDSVSHWKIGTLEGGHDVSPGDFIIRGVAGEYYPCKPDIFKKTYELAE